MNVQYPYKASIFFVSIAIVSLCVLVFLPGRQMRTDNRLYVVCTTSILADTVAHIGGDYVQVDCLMGPGIDPHVYRARESDMHKLAEADIIFYHGLHLEGKMGTLFERMRSGAVKVAVSDAIPKELLRIADVGELIYDPHVWHDVTLWKYAAAYIGKSLGLQDRLHKKEYRHAQELYIKDLNVLDTHIRTKVATLSQKQRILITAHDAFGYFGKAYGFEVVGLQGISTDSEISTQDIYRVVDILVMNDVRALFVESLIPQRAIEAVRDAVSARGKQVIIGPELFSDALGNKESGAHTYIDMMKYNVEALVYALGG